MEDQSRARFEEWILKKAKDLNYSYMDMVLKRFENGDYRTTWVDMAWIGWSGSMAEVDRLSSENRELQKFKDHMVELREAHGFESWAAALVEVDKLRAEVERVKSLNHQQFGDAIRRNAEIDRLKIRLEIVRNLLGSSVPSDAELDIAIDAALSAGAGS